MRAKCRLSRPVCSDDDYPEPEVTFDVVVETVAADVLPGSGAKREARTEAFIAVVESLREHGELRKKTFEDEIYPEYDVRFETDNSAWNCIYSGLQTLAERTDDVESADESGLWRWTGER